MKYKIIDNFLAESDFKKIKEEMLGANFPWFLNSTLVKTKELIDDRYNWQFTHTFYRNFSICSTYFEDLIDPLIIKLNPSALVRVKANLIPRTSEQIVHEFHLDHESFTGLVAIYYVNSNNGFTIFKNGDRIQSIENRLLIFEPNLLHTGTTCTDTRVRCLINFMFYEWSNQNILGQIDEL